VALPSSGPPLIRIVNPGQTNRGSYRLSNTRQTAGQLARNSHGLILRNALIDTAKPVHLNIPPHLRAKGAPGSYIVQSDRPLDQEFYDTLKKYGATNVSYIPNNAALAQATPEQARLMLDDPEFQAVLPWEPYYKLDPALLPSAVEQEPATSIYALRITTFPGQIDAAVAALSSLGATVIGQDRSPFGPTLIAQTPPDTLAAVARLPLAWEVEAYTPRQALNDLTRVVVGVATNSTTNAPNYLNLYGSNIWVNLNDTGAQASHPDLSNRVFGLRVDLDGHGTHVAGSIAGSGIESGSVTNPVPGSIIPGADFRGKAKGANLFVQGLDLLLGPYVSDAALQSNASYYLTTGAQTNGSLVTNGFISNNSWGYQAMLYDTPAASYDAATRDAQPAVPGEQAMLFVFAAGNSGNGSGSGTDGEAETITSPATAKNVITVGSIDSPRFITNEVSFDGVNTNEVFFSSTDNSNLVAYFSSAGNVGVGTEGDYGRFKPDVVAPGVFIVSCRSSNYVDPAIENTFEYLDLPGEIVNPAQSNIFPIILPLNVSGLTIQIVPNSQSPDPFPTLLIENGPKNPPGGTPASSPYTTTNNLAPGFWYVKIINTNVQPVAYDLNIYVYQTNTLGDYFEALSNMNATLKPYYLYQSGTSMSAAAVSGMLALMQQFIETSFPGNPNPSPALLKALLINGARSLGSPYDFNTQPSAGNEQGWGLVNIQNSIPASLTNANSSLWFADQSPSNALSTGQFISYKLSGADPAASNNPVRVTLVWTDPPGNPAAGIALVNNLDLTVLEGNGSNYVGNDFRAGDIFTEESGLTNPAPSDVVNNVENVYLAPPIAFPLTITVNGSRVNVNAVTTRTNQIAQDFALVISSDDTNLSSPLVIRTNGITSVTNALVTVANSGTPLLHQRVGANDPNLYNYALGQTNGGLAQWHFFVFTNNQFSATDRATNVLFATFYPPNLSRPRNSDADIDLYVSTSPNLTNLSAAAITGSLKSLNRGGNEFIYLSNSLPNEVYYIGVKSEDQQAADFGFYGVAQQAPFSSVNLQNGDITYYGTPIPATIPDGSFDFPGQVTMLAAFEGTGTVRKVMVKEGVQHQNPGDLTGTLTHPPSTVTDFLNDHTGFYPGFTNYYDDLSENPAVLSVPSDGPGSLRDFVGQPVEGEWQLSEVDNALGASGTVTAYSVTVSPQPPINGPIVIELPANGGSYYNFVNVPNDALYLTNVVIFESQAAGGPIGIFMTNVNDVTTSDYGVNNISPPGGYLVLGPTNNPPLSGGAWYYEIYNYGSTPVTLTNYIYFLTRLTPNLVEIFSNNVATPLTTDATTTSQICITNGQQVVDLQVGLRITDAALDDLSIHLTSPQGSSVLLFENRGGLQASNLGLSLSSTNSTNFVYTVFTEDTNLASTPIKFAPPPYA
jgi:subtilisin-like proprotein convertase family protein